MSSKDDRYGVEEMTFLQEEEVFSTPAVLDASVTETNIKAEVDGSDKVVKENHDGKRKQPDNQTEKKVCFSTCYQIWYVFV